MEAPLLKRLKIAHSNHKEKNNTGLSPSKKSKVKFKKKANRVDPEDWEFLSDGEKEASSVEKNNEPIHSINFGKFRPEKLMCLPVRIKDQELMVDTGAGNTLIR